MPKVITFDGGWTRTGRITAGITTCMGCKEVAVCLIIDGSEEEYNSGDICLECAKKLIEGVV